MTSAVNANADMSVEFAALRQDVAHLATAIGDLVRHQAAAAGFGVVDAVETAQGRIADTAAAARTSARRAGGEMQACIERNPLTSLLVVFGIAVSLGMISRARR